MADSYFNIAIFKISNNSIYPQSDLNLALSLYSDIVKIDSTNSDYTNKIQVINYIIDKLNESNSKSSIIRLAIQLTSNNQKSFQLYQDLLKAYEIENVDEQTYSETLNSTAWHALLSGNFVTAEELIRQGMAIPTENKFLYTNLAPSLLLQGKTQEAIEEYTKWAKVPFGMQDLPTYKDAFLADFNELKQAGVIPPERRKDVEMIIEMLKNM